MPAPTLESPGRVESADGSLQLSWGDQLADYEVRMRHGDEERIVYRGRMPSAHVSGLPNGEYQLQARARGDEGWSAWSEPTLLVVEHHPMSLVWTLVALGALVFAGTAVVVLRSDRSAR
ncbi:MAG: fibronectin type III domain-containing protein [Nannocystaceae bacterium]